MTVEPMVTATSEWWADAPLCDRCGQQHLQVWVNKEGKRSQSCVKHRSKRDPKTNTLRPCQAAPLIGHDSCRNHSGLNAKERAAKARQARAEADRNAHERAIKKAAAIFGVPRQVDPAEGLIEAYWKSAGLVEAYEKLILEVGPDDLMGGVIIEREERKMTELPDSVADVIADRSDLLAQAQAVETKIIVVKGARKHPLVKLYDEERDRFVRLGIEIVRLELEVRRDAYVRAQVDTFAQLLGKIGLTDDQRLKAARLLRELDGRPRVVDGQIV